MDTVATLSEIKSILSGVDTDRLAELADALDAWLRCGGFLPKGTTISDCRNIVNELQDALGSIDEVRTFIEHIPA